MGPVIARMPAEPPWASKDHILGCLRGTVSVHVWPESASDDPWRQTCYFTLPKVLVGCTVMGIQRSQVASYQLVACTHKLRLR